MSSEDTTANDVERMSTIGVGRRPDEMRPNQRGRYVLTEVLGQGGMGTVYAAYDPHLQRNVAIKVVRRGDRKQQKRLQREAAVMAQVQHANVVAVHDVEFDDEDVSLVMELVRGPNLSDWLKRTNPSWQEIVGAFIQAGRGLAVAHAAGIVHRDFKPGNVLVAPDGVFKVTDFGLAKPVAMEGSTGLQPASVPFTIAPTGKTQVPLAASVTVTGMVIGTFRYMAPEQQCGQPLDARADQFSFCVALWTALYGTPPFAGSEAELLRAKLQGPPLAPPRPQAPLPTPLVDAMRRGLQPSPQDRFGAMEPLLAELERSLQPARTAPWAGIILGGLGAIGLGAWAAMTLVESDNEAPPKDDEPAVVAEAVEPVVESSEPSESSAPPATDPNFVPHVAAAGPAPPPLEDPPVFDDWELVIEDVELRRTKTHFIVLANASFAEPPPGPVHLKVDACGAKIHYDADIEHLDTDEMHTFRDRVEVGSLVMRTKRCTLRFKLVDDEGRVVGYPQQVAWCAQDDEVKPGACKGPLRELFEGGKSEEEDQDEDRDDQPQPKGRPRASTVDLKDPFAG